MESSRALFGCFDQDYDGCLHSADVKMAMYCPQGSGTLRQQLLMRHGIAGYCMVLHGIAGYCMVLHGIAWHCMVLQYVMYVSKKIATKALL